MSQGQTGDTAGASEDARPSGQDTKGRAAGPHAARKRRPRWGRRIAITLGILVVLLAILVAAGPTIVSTKPVLGFAQSTANRMLRGQIDVGDASLSWFGPLEVQSMVVRDPDDREVVNVKNVRTDAGLWGILFGEHEFGELKIESPEIMLYITAENGISLADAFALRNPSPEEPEDAEAELPSIAGKLSLVDGRVRLVRPDGSTLEATNLNTNLTFASLGDIAGDLAVRVEQVGEVRGKIDVQGLVRDGAFSLDGSSGSVRLASTDALDLGPLAAFAAPDAGVSGKSSLSLSADFENGKVDGDLAVQLANVMSRRSQEQNAAPISADLHANLAATSTQLDAETTLSGGLGQARATLALRGLDRPLDVDAGRVISAALTGAAVELPDLNLLADANIDLAAVDRAFPGLLAAGKDSQITGGTLEVSRVAVTGGKAPTARGEVNLRDVTARTGGETANVSPVQLAFDARLEPGTGLRVEKAALDSQFAQLTAGGLATNLQAQFQTDLTALQRELRPLVAFGDLQLSGSVQGTIQLEQASDQRVDIRGETVASQLRFADAKGGGFDLKSGKFAQQGFITLADGKAQRLELQTVTADLDGQVLAQASGAYDLQTGAIEGDLDLRRADVGFLAGSRASGANGPEARLGGTITAQARVTRAASADPLILDGSATAQNLTADGRPLIDGQAELRWSKVRLAGDDGGVRAEKIELQSAPAQVTASGLHYGSGAQPVLDGKIEAAADLAGVFRALAAMNGNEPAEIGGKLRMQLTGTSNGEAVSIQAAGGIEGLEVGAGEQEVREERIDLACDATVDRSADLLELSKASVTSKLLSAEVRGKIDEFSSTRVLDLSGNYSASWPELTSVLHELAPATAKIVSINGASKSDFRVSGPLNHPDQQPEFRALTGTVQVGWESATVCGVQLGQARLAPELNDARVNLPRAAIPATRGQLNLGGTVDLKTEDPTLQIPGTLRLLDDVVLTGEIGEQLLSWVNPIFLQMARLEGTVALELQDINLPLGQSIQRAGQGRGKLEFQEVRAQPGGLLGEILELGGVPQREQYAVEISGLSFEIRDGRISYQDFTMVFPEQFDMRFRGSVGFDQTLELWVSVPVRAAMLEKLGVKGPVAEYAEALTGTRVEVPISGTRLAPKLDLSRVDVPALLKDVVGKSAERTVGDLLKGLQKPPPKEEEEQKPRR